MGPTSRVWVASQRILFGTVAPSDYAVSGTCYAKISGAADDARTGVPGRGGDLVTRGLSYSDAVVLLGGRSRAVAVVDRLTGGLLLAASASGVPLILNMFE